MSDKHPPASLDPRKVSTGDPEADKVLLDFIRRERFSIMGPHSHFRRISDQISEHYENKENDND